VARRVRHYNFADTPAGAEVVLPPASYERLQKIKATYDPNQTIISAHPVRPIGA
jgi:Berberine and berberine like